MNLLQSVLLGLIQGTTEWLPISSTGHLRVAERFFGFSVPLVFDVTLHVGTLFVTLIYFRGDVKNILSALFHRDIKSEDGKLIVPIIVGTVPTAIIAILVGNDLDKYFSTLLLLGAGFIAGGIVLFSSKFAVERKGVIGIPEAFLIGTMQGISIIPSISRSGLTIVIALLLGIKREVAFKFSFLLSIPAVLGALGLTLYQDGEAFSLAAISGTDIVVSLVMTVLVSFLALKLLWKTMAARKFYLFSIYCLTLGAALTILSLLGF
jgi:undecaprenyl-diphosphatase